MIDSLSKTGWCYYKYIALLLQLQHFWFSLLLKNKLMLTKLLIN